MSSTTTTQFYGLTQYIGTDKPDFADNNQAFRNVDADLHQVVQDSQGFTSDIADLTERVGNLDTDLTNLSGDLDGEKAKITALQNKELSQDTEISRVERNAQDMITAYNEASATSTHAYAVGDYFIYNNVLYQATAAIAVGATIVPDTNCTTTNVTSELIQLNTSLADIISEFENGVTIDATSLDYNDALYALNNAINRTKLTGNSYIVIGTNIFKCCVIVDAQTRFINHNFVDGTGDRDLILTVATAEAGCRYIVVTNGTSTDSSGVTVGQNVTLYYR